MKTIPQPEWCTHKPFTKKEHCFAMTQSEYRDRLLKKKCDTCHLSEYYNEKEFTKLKNQHYEKSS